MATKTVQRQQDSEHGGGTIRVEVETTRRLKLGEVTYEETTDGGRSVIMVSGENILNREVGEDEIASIVRFFSSFQRRQGRSGNDGAFNGRGEVRDASTDGRIKGNEEMRPHDPDRARSSGRAR